MKKLTFTILSIFLFTILVNAQIPQAFKYQAVVRDAGGQVMANQSITLGVDLLQNGNTVYSEDQPATTNDFGLVNLEIGRGTVLSGTFDQIDWSVPTTVRLWLDSGNGFQQIGDSELLSVPYAMYAANGGGGADDDPDPTNELQTLSQNGSEITLSNNGGTVSINDADADPTNELQNWSNLPGIPADIADGDQVDDADADPANEIEMPTDAEAGDMVYYDGQSWKRIIKGGEGQVLTMGADGVPHWDGLISITLPNGDEVFFAPADIEGTGTVSSGTSVAWGPTNIDIPNLPNVANANDAAMDYNGEGNTAAIVAALGNYDPPNSTFTYAAKLCDDLVAYGYDDWYLPAAGELKFAYSQTFLNFENTGIVGYWSSTETSMGSAWVFDVPDGEILLSGEKDLSTFFPDARIKCRCARRN